MLKRSFLLAGAVALFPFTSISAQELKLPQEPASVEVPAVPAAVPDIAALKARYAEYYSALKVYSEAAFAAPQDSPEFMEASAAGQYLRAKMDGVEAIAGKPVPADVSRAPGGVSAAVRAELEGVFGFNGAAGERAAGTRGVPIKAGYCQINYVKNATPFLVQYDGFLKKGEVIITFDDGPGPLTAEVSASMKEAGAEGVFFTLGSKLNAAGKARIKAASAYGHYVSVHGYNHATADGKPFTALSW